MSLFHDNPEKVTASVLESLALIQPESAEVKDALVINKQLSTAERVSIVCMGSINTLPTLAGYVGSGLADIFVAGNLEAAPGPQACLQALELADRGHGVLFLVANNAGTLLSASLALQKARQNGLNVNLVVVAEDVAVAPRVESAAKENFNSARRGLLGIVPLLKIAAAAAADGKTLTETTIIAATFAENMATLSLVAAADGRLHINTGLNDESCEKNLLPLNTDALAALLLPRLTADLALRQNEKLLLLVSGFGHAALWEQLNLYRACHKLLAAQGFIIAASHVGPLMELNVGNGLEICLVRLDDDLLKYWQTPCRSPYFKN